MSYEYLTPTQFKDLTGLDDAGIAELDPPDSMTLLAMIALNSNTKGRFSFKVDQSGLFAACSWVNYYTTDGGNYRIDEETGAASLLNPQQKDIVIA